MSERVEVTIEADGKVQIEAIDYHGKGCLAATEKLEKALGTVENRKAKTEQFATVTAGVKIGRGK